MAAAAAEHDRGLGLVWQCTRDYLGMVPFRLFEAGKSIAQIEPAVFYKEVLRHPAALAHPPAISHTKHVCKMAIQAYERAGIPVDGDIYELCAEMMAMPSSGSGLGLEWCYKTYCTRTGSGNAGGGGEGASFGALAVVKTEATAALSQALSMQWATLKERKQIISEGTTGLSTWDGALALCEWTVQNRETFAAKRVLELGCGTGLVGIVTAMTTAAAAVTLTDFDPTVLEVAAANLALNVPHNADHSVKKLDWFNIASESEGWIGAVDMIVASDVVYDPDLVPPLVEVLLAALQPTPRSAGRGGAAPEPKVALLSLTRRNPETSVLFLKALADKGLVVVPLDPPPAVLFPRQRDAVIKILRITLV